jgi:hypothetical protein
MGLLNTPILFGHELLSEENSIRRVRENQIGTFETMIDLKFLQPTQGS